MPAEKKEKFWLESPSPLSRLLKLGSCELLPASRSISLHRAGSLSISRSTAESREVFLENDSSYTVRKINNHSSEK